MSRTYLKWTEEELKFLKENYTSKSKDFLRKHLRDRKWGPLLKKLKFLICQIGEG